MADCQCGGGLGKLGTANCIIQESVAARDIFVPLYDSDGNRNSIKNTDFVNGKLPDSYVQAKLDSGVWNITPGTYEEATPGRTDSIVQTSSLGTQKRLFPGVKTFSYQLWNVPTAWSAQLNQASCQEIGVFKIDVDGKLGGELSPDGTELYPRAIQTNSLEARDFDATATEGQYTLIEYQLDRKSDESQFFTYGANVLETDFLNARSLIAANLIEGSGTTTATDIFVTLKDFAYQPVLGYDEISDWSIVDAALAPVTPSAIQELSNGEYQITIPSTPSQNVTVSLVKTRNSSVEILYSADPIVIAIP